VTAAPPIHLQLRVLGAGPSQLGPARLGLAQSTGVLP
jgi:hypothetical protein